MWNCLNATETGERGVKLAEEERDTSGAVFYKIKHTIGASWTLFEIDLIYHVHTYAW